jgi:hypothetical protein
VKSPTRTRKRPADEEPTDADLAAIDREMPLIEAEINLLDAQIRCLMTGGRASELHWRRLRRAEHAVLRIAAQLAIPTRTDLDRAA